MSQTAIFGPFLALMLLTIVVWVYMFARRIPLIQSSGIESNELTPAKLDEISPPAVSNPSDNLKNLFEVPLLFYSLCLYLFATSHVDSAYVSAAWLFVILRVLHSAVHCTVNIVLLRFGLYVLSSLAVFFMLIRAALNHFGAAN